jgi:hypothetical protein
MSIEYDCYGYFAIDHAHNIYPIRNAERHLESILSLQKGDVLYLKGIGHLQVINLYVDEYDYINKGKQGLYQEVAVSCKRIEY